MMQLNDDLQRSAQSADRADLDDLAEALDRLRAVDALALPWITQASAQPYLEAAETLTYREARPVVGSGDKEVRQDFEVCMDIPGGSIFRNFAQALEADLKAASALLEPDPLPEGFTLDDLIVQRYPVGCRGITPHVDHVRYQGLVAIIVFGGRGLFETLADRQGADPKPVETAPGDLLLMAAPGFDGEKRRPFHRLSEVTEKRVILGLRWDTRPGQPI